MIRGARVARNDSVSRDRGDEPLTAEWGINEEAAGFANMYRLGRITVNQAAQDILMSDEVLLFLIREHPRYEVILRAIQQRRQRTCEVFLAMVGGVNAYVQ